MVFTRNTDNYILLEQCRWWPIARSGNGNAGFRISIYLVHPSFVTPLHLRRLIRSDKIYVRGAVGVSNMCTYTYVHTRERTTRTFSFLAPLQLPDQLQIKDLSESDLSSRRSKLYIERFVSDHTVLPGDATKQFGWDLYSLSPFISYWEADRSHRPTSCR